MGKLEALKLIKLIRKNTFRALNAKDFCDEMIELLHSKAAPTIIPSSGRKLITLRVDNLSIGLFDDNTLMMRNSNSGAEPDMTMVPIYLFKEVQDLFGFVESTQ